MEVGDSIGWDYEKIVGSEFDIAYVITFEIYDGSDMGSSDVFFDSLNDSKPVFLLLEHMVEPGISVLTWPESKWPRSYDVICVPRHQYK